MACIVKDKAGRVYITKSQIISNVLFGDDNPEVLQMWTLEYTLNGIRIIFRSLAGGFVSDTSNTALAAGTCYSDISEAEEKLAALKESDPKHPWNMVQWNLL